MSRLADLLSPWPADGIRSEDYRGTRSDLPEDPSLAWRLRQPLVPAAKGALRSLGTLTADRRVLPDYLIIGGKRTGSTTLARNLSRADDVLALFPRQEDIKGAYYFDVHHARGERWYRSHFPTAQQRDSARESLGRAVVCGEASPYYLQHPHAAARAAELVPDAKIICVLRDPIERAYSHYRERVKQGLEPLGSFEEAIDAEPARLAGELERMDADPTYVSLPHLNFGYVAQSIYAPAVERWSAAFAPQNLLVLRSEELFAQPGKTLAVVRDFLGLDKIPTEDPKHYNSLPGAPLTENLRASLENRFAADQVLVKDLFGI